MAHLSHKEPEEPKNEINQIVIDKITITVPIIDEERKKEMKSYALNMVSAGLDSENKHLGNGYRLNIIKAVEGTDQTILLSLDPYRTGYAFFRAEFNPAKLGPEGTDWAMSVTITENLYHGEPELYQDGRISRIDVALDIPGVMLSDLIVTHTHPTTSRNFYTDGKLQTLYLGKTKSNQFRVYDKAAEQLSKGLKPNSAVTRIERVVRKNCPKLRHIKALPNPFTNLKVASVGPCPAKLNGYEWEFFKSHSAKVGGQAALLSLPPTLRKRYRKALESLTPEFWDVEGVWANWEKAVDDSKILAAMPPFTLSLSEE